MEQDLYLKGEEKFGLFTSRLYSGFSGIPSRMIYDQVKKRVAETAPSTILDVGCGPGDLLLKTAADNGNMKLYGVDPSPHMVEIAERKIRSMGLQDLVKVELGSSRKVPFGEKFDLIISSFSFHHWKEQEGSLGYLLNLLGKSGRLVILELNGESCPGKFPFIKKHSMSRDFASEFNFPGFNTKVEFSENSRIISLIFDRKD